MDRPADVTPESLPPAFASLAFVARTPAGPVRVQSRLAGRFNVYNLLAAVATGVALDLPAQAIEAGLEGVASVPGRFQIVSLPGDDVTVIVDYAHTDDALKNLLEAVRPIAAARLTTVFGCGGDRDRSKRPLMGAVAARLSDTVGLTSDNPRSEDPERIIDEIELGFAPPQDRGRPDGGAASTTGIGLRWWRLADRRAAIDRAIAEAGPGDVVVIAGKGSREVPGHPRPCAPVRRCERSPERARAPAHAEGLVSAAEVRLTAARAAAAMAGSLVAGPRRRRDRRRLHRHAHAAGR